MIWNPRGKGGPDVAVTIALPGMARMVKVPNRESKFGEVDVPKSKI